MGELIVQAHTENIIPSGLTESSLVTKTRQNLAALPLEAVRKAGIWRDRKFYFLNISYPSMQAENVWKVMSG